MLAKFFPIGFALAIAIGALAEMAFTSSGVYTIAAAIKDADTAVVTVRGTAVSLGDNHFVLVDDTGRCELQTCPTWFREIALLPNERVTVTGEVIRHIGPAPGTLYTLGVQRIEREHRPEIVVRQGIGKPEWAMGRTVANR